MSWNNFDNSTAGEGGFMNTTVNDSTAGEDKANLKRGQNCVPVMIAHLVRYGEKLTVWGTPVRLVTFVGLVRKVEPTSTKVSFEFSDDTGNISGLKWLEGDSANYESPVKVNSYARVHGMIRDQGEDHYVLIVNIQPMDHLMELLSHHMEVTLMSLQGDSMVNKVANNDHSMGNQSVQNGSVNNSNANSGLNRQQQMVLDIIENSDPEFGAERDQIKSAVAPNVPPQMVDEILEFLFAEGHIYTTKTDDYFKAI
ncbi:replication protein A2 [Nasonia vitripennis]|uniref:Replication protein A C-terminal domain-containing protein n=2 Tax=Nasonia vitripennis TaxID=7425 RepID=A0A7M6UM25_NASVI|nr:replication protein A2 [Nasonia vitripennis]